ncbi:MAG: M1 family metallopeptidase [Cyclobacteriaceae bacterium]
MRYIILCILSLLSFQVLSQSLFSPSDTLKGGLRPERTSYDVHYYDLEVEVFPEEKALSGSSTIHFTAKESTRRIQVDLFSNLQVTDIVSATPIASYERLYGAIFINFKENLPPGSTHSVKIDYKGEPHEAIKAPWDGGFSWKKDKLDRHWIATSVQGEGASLWWPVKEHLSDEPDSVSITCTVPEGLTCVSNGNLQSQSTKDGKSTFTWCVANPINVYNVALNIGHYVTIEDTIHEDKGPLPASYYVLDYHEQKAREAFPGQVDEMFDHFNRILGPYPFPEDGFALVEVPYWGMEHQSAVAYGNRFVINDYGFDFILIHESGHEYFGNSITAPDPAELWIHEAFTTYLEVLFLESRDGYRKSIEYLQTKKPLIENNRPVLGPKGVYFAEWTDADMYYKGAWMLQSLRHTINGGDDKWYGLIRDFYQTFKGRTVDTDMVISFFEQQSGMSLRSIFSHFLTELDPPHLQYKREGKNLSYRWLNTDDGFNMPVEILAGRKSVRLYPTTQWQTTKLPKGSEVKWSDDKFYFTEEKTD